MAHTVLALGLQAVTRQRRGQDLVPRALRCSARQLAAVRVWVKVLLAHTVLALGVQAVTGQLRGQDLVPRVLRRSTRQLAAVRVWVKVLLAHTVLALGLQAVAAQLRGQDLVRVTTRVCSAVGQVLGQGRRAAPVEQTRRCV